MFKIKYKYLNQILIKLLLFVLLVFYWLLQVRRATEAVQRLCQCPSNKCSKLKVRKVGEGRYHIAGRNVFIRVSDFYIFNLIFFIFKSTIQIKYFQIFPELHFYISTNGIFCLKTFLKIKGDFSFKKKFNIKKKFYENV